jgi:hypothetical protein
MYLLLSPKRMCNMDGVSAGIIQQWNHVITRKQTITSHIAKHWNKRALYNILFRRPYENQTLYYQNMKWNPIDK